MCCTAMAIDVPEIAKDAGEPCRNCVLAANGKVTPGCKIYATRPQLCRDYECEWLGSRTLPATLRPDKVGTILMDDEETGEYRAVCDPQKPLAWRHPLMFAHLVAMAKAGRTVVAKAGRDSWHIYESGQYKPTV